MEHKSRYGMVHDWDCPPCVKADADRAERDNAENPHRPGTKVHSEWARMAASSRMGSDPRTETYWSM